MTTDAELEHLARAVPSADWSLIWAHMAIPYIRCGANTDAPSDAAFIASWSPERALAALAVIAAAKHEHGAYNVSGSSNTECPICAAVDAWDQLP